MCGRSVQLACPLCLLKRGVQCVTGKHAEMLCEEQCISDKRKAILIAESNPVYDNSDIQALAPPTFPSTLNGHALTFPS